MSSNLQLLVQMHQSNCEHLMSMLTRERAARRVLEARVSAALEAEKASRERASTALASVRQCHELQAKVRSLSDKNAQLETAIAELRGRFQIESDVAAAQAAVRVKAADESLRLALARHERAKEDWNQQLENCKQMYEDLTIANKNEIHALQQIHEEKLQSLHSELQSVKAQAAVELSICAIEKEEEVAKLLERIRSLEAENSKLNFECSKSSEKIATLTQLVQDSDKKSSAEISNLRSANHDLMIKLQRLNSSRPAGAKAVSARPRLYRQLEVIQSQRRTVAVSPNLNDVIPFQIPPFSDSLLHQLPAPEQQNSCVSAVSVFRPRPQFSLKRPVICHTVKICDSVLTSDNVVASYASAKDLARSTSEDVPVVLKQHNEKNMPYLLSSEKKSPAKCAINTANKENVFISPQQEVGNSAIINSSPMADHQKIATILNTEGEMNVGGGPKCQATLPVEDDLTEECDLDFSSWSSVSSPSSEPCVQELSIGAEVAVCSSDTPRTAHLRQKKEREDLETNIKKRKRRLYSREQDLLTGEDEVIDLKDNMASNGKNRKTRTVDLVKGRMY